ncbi:hypothetical protein Leryth_022271 [Lithospermum erythrorhizon]|nr:hypothetical protein Leryth_022271 [Lithospermum erythrorhizon]
MDTTAQFKKAKQEANHITLRVQRYNEEDAYIRIRPNVHLRSLMEKYCDRLGEAYGTIRFLFDGQRVQGHNTAEEMGMADMDIIDAMTEATGGSACRSF